MKTCHIVAQLRENGRLVYYAGKKLGHNVWCSTPAEALPFVQRPGAVLRAAGMEKAIVLPCAGVRSNPAGGRWSLRDTRAIRAAFAALSAKARRHWRSKTPPMPRSRALGLVQRLAGVKANPPGPGPFIVAVGASGSRQYVSGLVNEPERVRLTLTTHATEARRLGRLATARLVRLIRSRSRAPVTILPA